LHQIVVANGDSAQLFVDPVLAALHRWFSTAAMPSVYVNKKALQRATNRKLGLLTFDHSVLTLQWRVAANELVGVQPLVNFMLLMKPSRVSVHAPRFKIILVTLLF
jgi:hypothetical protein